MAKELAKMREIRIKQAEVRTSLKNREEANKTLSLLSCAVEGRQKTAI